MATHTEHRKVKTMEKIKIDIVAETAEPVDFDVYIGSAILKATTWIPYEQKIEFAKEYASMVIAVDEDTGRYKKIPFAYPVETYLAMKYYTNLDTEDCTAEDVYNFVLRSIRNSRLSEVISEDVKDTMCMAEAVVASIIDDNNYANSAGYKIMKSFGSLFTGEDIAETLAKTQEVNEDMIKVIGLLNAEKQKSKKVIPSMIDFTKRDE